ncbi:hypothetical protein VNI00_006820 [Paramarasmius palmivorus]|uniref:Uncharacterized protein n=1 Tax=Paramarasmius palmivorus TaxID=297713 RepID=A0AAW0D731_9AGAR
MAPPIHTELSSSDEDDAPETVTLSQSKKNVKKHDDALRQLEAAEREKKRTKNRERDRRLKEQAVKSRKKKGDESEEDGIEDDNAEARMLRAMQQAEDEGSEDSDEEMGEGDLTGEEEEGSDDDANMNAVDEEDSEEDSENELQDEDMEDMSDDEGESSEGSETEGIEGQVAKTKAKHLPDYIFTSASAAPTKKPARTKEVIPPKPPKRKRSGKGPKEVVIGSRSIQALSSKDPFPVISSTMVPSAKVRKFLDRGLSLKGAKSKSRGWERRPVNIGSMRRQGPAANFVRNP